ncbi:MAG: hypothetical protein OEY18_10890 [Candidatus Aminicenantes bacterium]|nr:hypothetical protein [Candidatus Aminicenantes bacterium]
MKALNTSGRMKMKEVMRKAERRRAALIFVRALWPRIFFDRRLPMPDEKSRVKMIKAME